MKKSKTRLVITAGIGLLLLYLGLGAYEDLELGATLSRGPEDPPQPVSYNGIPLGSQWALDVYRLETRRDKLFPWVEFMAYRWQAVIICIISAGFLGGFIREVRDFSNHRRTIFPPHAALGIGVALLLAAVLLIFPHLVIDASAFEYRSYFIVLLSLVVGCFGEETWQKIKSRVQELGEK